MGKRDQGAAVDGYIKDGYLSEAVFNFLSLLGWSPKDETEVFPITEILERFSLDGVNRSPSKFDSEKCSWINQQHLMQRSAEEFSKKAKLYVIDAGFHLPEHYPAIAASVQEKVKLFTEVPNAISFYLCLLYTSPSPRDQRGSRMPSSA